MNIAQALILGLIQGVAEFLPISSSGHLVMAQYFMGWVESDLLFSVFLHVGTLLAVMIFFWRELISLSLHEVRLILVSAIPAALVGLLFGDILTQIFNLEVIVGGALLVTGLMNLISDQKLTQRDQTAVQSAQSSQTVQSYTVQQALVVGLFQAVALIPGISRSGSTVLGSIIQGIDRRQAFKFSFIMSVPVIIGAMILQLIEALQQDVTIAVLPWAFGLVMSFVVGLASLYLLRLVIEKSKLRIFGIYCLLAGVAVLIII